jgi:hypothetical protein
MQPKRLSPLGKRALREAPSVISRGVWWAEPLPHRTGHMYTRTVLYVYYPVTEVTLDSPHGRLYYWWVTSERTGGYRVGGYRVLSNQSPLHCAWPYRYAISATNTASQLRGSLPPSSLATLSPTRASVLLVPKSPLKTGPANTQSPPRCAMLVRICLFLKGFAASLWLRKGDAGCRDVNHALHSHRPTKGWTFHPISG